MAYLKPNPITQRMFNPLAMRFGLSGSVTLVVAGRRSGQPKRIPVIPVDLDGARYLVSTRGEAEWVRNLRASGMGELQSKATTQRFRATEVPVAERPPIIAAYRRVAGRTVTSYFTALPDPADHPVFRIESRDA